MRITHVVAGSLIHATRHGVSLDEMEQMFFNAPTVGRNKRRRAAPFTAVGRTDGGRRVRVNFVYEQDTGAARVISAWEL